MLKYIHASCHWLAVALCGFATPAYSYSLTGIYDFRPLVTDNASFTAEQRQYPALVYEFEGLTFTQDGSLWASIAADPQGAPREFWKLDLKNRAVSTRVPDPVENHPLNPLGVSNPVGLASTGDQLIVGENGHVFGNLIWAFRPGSGQTYDWFVPLAVGVCNEVEGLASVGGKLYASCQNDNKVLEIANPETSATLEVTRIFTFQEQVLGLEEMSDSRLIVGGYPSRTLIIFDPSGHKPTETVSLESLFKGTNSDYYRLTGEVYSVQVVPSEGFRSRPDPDGLAYGSDGKIYMSFDGDLRIFEISPDGINLPAIPESDIYTMMLVGLGLVGWQLRRTNRRIAGRRLL